MEEKLGSVDGKEGDGLANEDKAIKKREGIETI
jgi:hypothetical protein